MSAAALEERKMSISKGTKDERTKMRDDLESVIARYSEYLGFKTGIDGCAVVMPAFIVAEHLTSYLEVFTAFLAGYDEWGEHQHPPDEDS